MRTKSLILLFLTLILFFQLLHLHYQPRFLEESVVECQDCIDITEMHDDDGETSAYDNDPIQIPYTIYPCPQDKDGKDLEEDWECRWFFEKKHF